MALSFGTLEKILVCRPCNHKVLFLMFKSLLSPSRVNHLLLEGPKYFVHTLILILIPTQKTARTKFDSHYAPEPSMAPPTSALSSIKLVNTGLMSEWKNAQNNMLEKMKKSSVLPGKKGFLPQPLLLCPISTFLLLSLFFSSNLNLTRSLLRGESG